MLFLIYLFVSIHAEDHEHCLENDDCPQQLAHQAATTGKVSLLMEAVNHDPSALESQDEKGRRCHSDVRGNLQMLVINKSLLHFTPSFQAVVANSGGR